MSLPRPPRAERSEMRVLAKERFRIPAWSLGRGRGEREGEGEGEIGEEGKGQEEKKRGEGKKRTRWTDLHGSEGEIRDDVSLFNLSSLAPAEKILKKSNIQK